LVVLEAGVRREESDEASRALEVDAIRAVRMAVDGCTVERENN
jgi:hypothetical protein